jgi:hypothetical protein
MSLTKNQVALKKTSTIIVSTLRKDVFTRTRLNLKPISENIPGPLFLVLSKLTLVFSYTEKLNLMLIKKIMDK